MPEFRVTFGQKYRREVHPSGVGIHPDGWVTVVAASYLAARAATVAAFGEDWCGLGTPSTDDVALYPLGEIGRIDTHAAGARHA